jgi:tyrosinase
MSSTTTDDGMNPDEDSTWLQQQQQQQPPPPPGSNKACTSNAGTPRIRREWDRLDNYDRALYLDAVETAIERGLHQRFAVFHFDELSEVQAHDTCGFYLWHRSFVVAYENMLRSLEPRFACLALPHWDIYSDYQKQKSSANACKSYATCAKIINDLGGIVENDDFEERTFFGRKVDGLWHFKPPLQNLRDDNNQVGLIRYDLWFDPIPEDANVLSATNLARLFGTKDRLAFWETLHHGIHDSVHDTIGGFMRTPASPIDPLFMPWHSTMEFFDYIWEACHGSADDNNPPTWSSDNGSCLYTRHAREHFPNLSLSTDEVHMKLGNTTDIRDDPWIGRYFSHANRFEDLWTIRELDEHHRFRYANIPDNFVEALANNPQACPNGLSSVLSLQQEPSTETDTLANTTNYTVVRREPPMFSNEELDAFKQNWIEEARAYYNGTVDIASAAIGNHSPPTLLHQQGRQHDSENNSSNILLCMDFVRCILFEAMDRDTIERWAIDEDAFLNQVVVNERYNTHPLCRDRLSDASDDASSETILTNTTVASSSSSSSSAAYHAPCDHSSRILTALLICLVSKFSR